jgi:hypothetical protein
MGPYAGSHYPRRHSRCQRKSSVGVGGVLTTWLAADDIDAVSVQNVGLIGRIRRAAEAGVSPVRRMGPLHRADANDDGHTDNRWAAAGSLACSPRAPITDRPSCRT